MSGRVFTLGPQHPRPNLPALLDRLEVQAPVAVISAGWRHDEAQLDALARAVDRRLVHLPLYRWFDELEQEGAPIIDAWHRRQADIRAFKRAVAIELRAATEVQQRLEAEAREHTALFDEEIAYARDAVRVLDRRTLHRLDEIRARFPETLAPWEQAPVARYRAGIEKRLAACRCLCIAGGHAAILLNRMAFFGVDRLLKPWVEAGGTLVAWSAGAMVLTERVVLFYDDPPEGVGDPELLDHGLGLAPGTVLLPQARNRMRLDDPRRTGLMARRFAPARCLTLENGAALEWVDGQPVACGGAETVQELHPDGSVLSLQPAAGSTTPDPQGEANPGPPALRGFRPTSVEDVRVESDEPERGGGSQALADLGARLRAQPHDVRKTLDTFVATHDFPLVDDNAATFFFYDGHHADQVELVHWVYGLESAQPLQRLAGTDAWFRQVELPARARVEYKLAVTRNGEKRWVLDPLNPRLAFDPFGSNSVCPMPGYRRPAWVRREPHVRRGRLAPFMLRSKVYGDERNVTVYLPNEYRADKAYPLLICHDGSDYRRFADIVPVLDNLIHRHELRPLVVAFTDGADRNREYGADPRQPAFLVEDLLPALEARFALSRDPEDRGLMGASFGGVASLYTAWTHPGMFRRLLLQSGSFVFTDVGHHGRSDLWDPVVAFVNALRQQPERVVGRAYMSCGRFESLIAYNRALVPLLRRAGLGVRFEESDDGHNWVCWRDRLRAGLTWLYPGHLWMVYD